MLKISKLKLENFSLTVKLELFVDPRKVLPLQIVNILRRILLTRIKIVGIDRVVFFINESSLTDELLEFRISQVPVFTDDPNMTLYLNVQCSTKEYEHCPIYSDYIIPEDPQKCKIQKDIILTYLNPGKKIEAVILLKEGTGKEDIRFSPVTIVKFKEIDKQTYEFTFEVNEGYDIKDVFRKAINELKIVYPEFKVKLKDL